jgi:DNA replication protein DnaC
VSAIRELADCPVDLFDVPVAHLHALITDPYAQQVVDAKCHHCDTVLQCQRIVAPFLACDECIERHKEAETTERHRKFWEHVCPERFRSTDPKHADFPGAIFADLKKALRDNSNQSFFLYGPTGSCKTRVGMLLLKMQLHWFNRRVGVLWPEKVRTLSQGFETTTFDHYANYDVLLMDDVLLTSVRESKLMDAVKQLIDVRMRHERPFIITSQIGTEDDLKDGKEFGDAKTADVERIKALLRRLREDCRVVSFAKAEPKEGQEAF